MFFKPSKLSLYDGYLINLSLYEKIFIAISGYEIIFNSNVSENFAISYVLEVVPHYNPANKTEPQFSPTSAHLAEAKEHCQEDFNRIKELLNVV